MSEQHDVIVKTDDRVRLMGAVLAATNYPDEVQRTKPHGTHAHARTTRKHMSQFSDHPAVQSTQNLLDQNTPLEALYALVMLMEWPGMKIAALPSWAPKNYGGQLQSLYEKAELEQFWQQEKNVWDKARTESLRVFNDEIQFKSFIEPFLGEVADTFVFIPSISYPSNYDIGLHLGKELICIAPPPLAWGDSPPWPYDEATQITYSYRAAMMVFGRILLRDYLHKHAEDLEEIVKTELPLTDQFKAQYPTWEEQFSTLFLSAVVAMYLEKHVDEQEYKSYMLMEKKARGMTNLPGTVSVMRRFLQEVGGGKYDTLIEFLPFFPKQLRVAQRIVTF